MQICLAVATSRSFDRRPFSYFSRRPDTSLWSAFRSLIASSFPSRARVRAAARRWVVVCLLAVGMRLSLVQDWPTPTTSSPRWFRMRAMAQRAGEFLQVRQDVADENEGQDAHDDANRQRRRAQGR